MLGEPKRIAEAFAYDPSREVEPPVSSSNAAGPNQAATPPARVGGLPPGVAALPSAERRQRLRILEAMLFATREPLDEATLSANLPAGDLIGPLLEELQNLYAGRGVNLVRVAGKWSFRTADDLSYLLEKRSTEERKLSKAALETMAIIAYHQPVTRAEIEDIRGVQASKGTLDVLLEIGWIRMRGRRRAPGRPVTYGTTEEFLKHFGFDNLRDLPGAAELKGAGLLDTALPPDFQMPDPQDVAALMPDEDPLEEEDRQLDLLEPLDDEDDDAVAIQDEKAPDASSDPSTST